MSEEDLKPGDVVWLVCGVDVGYDSFAFIFPVQIWKPCESCSYPGYVAFKESGELFHTCECCIVTLSKEGAQYKAQEINKKHLQFILRNIAEKAQEAKYLEYLVYNPSCVPCNERGEKE